MPGGAFDRGGFALHVIDPKLGAPVVVEIKPRQVAVEVLGINVPAHADDAPLEDREKAFERIGVNVAARSFKLGVVNGFVLCGLEFENRRAVRHQTAVGVKLAVEQAADAAMVNDHGADRTATLNKAENIDVAVYPTRTMSQPHVVADLQNSAS